MPPTKRASDDLTRPKKRVKSSTARSTVSQPIAVDSQLSPSPSRLSPRRALVEASQASTFESQLRESRPEDAIIAPTECSEKVTAASLPAALDNETLQEALDAGLMDDFEGVDWGRLRKYMKPLSSQKSRKSWIYRYGYRVALLKDPGKLYFVCRHCYEHKYTDTGVGIYETTLSTSSAQRHLELPKRGHGHSKSAVAAKPTWLQRLLKDGNNSVSQKVANELAGFNTQRFPASSC
ncbi:Nn.00g101600.m01.CDS01 [Neocucurbitaria sp. VM-36]